MPEPKTTTVSKKEIAEEANEYAQTTIDLLTSSLPCTGKSILLIAVVGLALINYARGMAEQAGMGKAVVDEMLRSIGFVDVH